MSKSFSHAGVSRLNGEFKVRFANDSSRVKVLIKNGHTDIDIIELKHAMTKEEAVQYLIDIDFATQNGVTNEEVKAALLAEQGKRADEPKEPKEPKVKAERAPRVKKEKEPKEITLDAIAARAPAKKAAPKSTVSRAEVVAQLAELEDAPF